MCVRAAVPHGYAFQIQNKHFPAHSTGFHLSQNHREGGRLLIHGKKSDSARSQGRQIAAVQAIPNGTESWSGTFCCGFFQ